MKQTKLIYSEVEGNPPLAVDWVEHLHKWHSNIYECFVIMFAYGGDYVEWIYESEEQRDKEYERILKELKE